MRWTGAVGLRAQVQKAWDRGELLSCLVTGEASFPKRLTLKVPSSAEVAERFDEVRTWIAELQALPHFRVEMREFTHRIFGANAIPCEAWVDTLAQSLAVIGKERAAARFSKMVELTRTQQPPLLDWLAKRPLRALELYEEWGQLLSIVSWMQRHPRPGVYLRQVDLPGVHSKFIEAYRGVLSELFDLVLPPEAYDAALSGVGRFAGRYGFLEKPLRIRFRFLDPDNPFPHFGFPHDITLDAGSFARLKPNVSRVFTTENETNFLAFPSARDSMVIFGAGYGFEMLAGARWLSDCRIYYWGDIDTHGFAILDQLRGVFEHVESFLMDRDTLLSLRDMWGEEDKPLKRDLPRLTSEETSLYEDLRANRLAKNLRLEQERIGFGWVRTALAALEDASSAPLPAEEDSLSGC